MNTSSSKTNIMNIQKAVTRKGPSTRSILFGRGGIGALRGQQHLWDCGNTIALQGLSHWAASEWECHCEASTPFGPQTSIQVVSQSVHPSVRPYWQHQLSRLYIHSGAIITQPIERIWSAQALLVLLYEESRIRRWCSSFST